jgi:hypothetical protein
MKAKHDVRSKIPYGPNIVRAWFDTVFHYALGGLENERGFLTRRNWTFRGRSGTFEYLGSVRELVPPAAKVNLSQFVSFFPEVGETIDRHDDCLERLARVCGVLYEAILNNSHFREVFAAVEGEVRQKLGREFQSYFGAYSSERDFMGIIAEYLINNIENLPDHYSTAELWNHYRVRFVQAISAPELEPLRDDTTLAGRNLIEVVDELTSLLEKTRSELSLQFDVPIVVEVNSDR